MTCDLNNSSFYLWCLMEGLHLTGGWPEFKWIIIDIEISDDDGRGGDDCDNDGGGDDSDDDAAYVEDDNVIT